MRSDELVISSIVISSYYAFLNPKPKKTNESHTKHSNYIKWSIEFLFNPIELRAYFFVLIEEKKMKETRKGFLFFIEKSNRLLFLSNSNNDQSDFNLPSRGTNNYSSSSSSSPSSPSRCLENRNKDLKTGDSCESRKYTIFLTISSLSFSSKPSISRRSS